MLILDFETRSRADLPAVGSYNYAVDLSTDILCLAAYDTETMGKWTWVPGETIPDSLVYRLKHADFIVHIGMECISVAYVLPHLCKVFPFGLFTVFH